VQKRLLATPHGTAVYRDTRKYPLPKIKKWNKKASFRRPFMNKLVKNRIPQFVKYINKVCGFADVVEAVADFPPMLNQWSGFFIRRLAILRLFKGPL
jgi:hypothetical protein